MSQKIHKIFGMVKLVGGVCLLIVLLSLFVWLTVKGKQGNIQISAKTFPDIVQYGNFKGFKISEFAANLGKPTAMIFTPDGRLFVADSGNNLIWLLKGLKKDGQARVRMVFADKIINPQALDFKKGKLYVGTDKGLSVLEDFDNNGQVDTRQDIKINKQNLQIKSILAARDNYIYVGLTPVDFQKDNNNILEGKIIRLSANSFKEFDYASGLANPRAIRFHPQTGEMIMLDAGNHQIGAEINMLLKSGLDYGYPECIGYDQSNKCPKTVPAMYWLENKEFGITGGMGFYIGDKWPMPYKYSLFMVIGGANPGIERITLKKIDLQYVIEAVRFANAFINPVDLKQGPDQNIYVLDKSAAKVYRIYSVFR